MTNKERIRRTLQHQESDIVPYSVWLTSEAEMKMVEFYGDRNFTSKVNNHVTTLARIPVPERAGWINPNFYQDEFGAVWDRTMDRDIGVVCQPVVTPENLDSYVLPDPHESRCYQHVRSQITTHQDQFIMADVGFSFFERAWILRGMENLLMDFVDDEPFVNSLLDRLMYWILDVVDEYSQYREIDAIHFGDDWGQQHGLIMGPTIWRKYFKPRLAVIYGEVKKSGKHVSIHSCGDIQEIIPDLIEIGLDMFNPFQPEVMDVYEMKRRYGGSLTFFGGISLQRTLAFGTPAEVRAEVLERLDRLGAGGGYVANACHAITKDVPAENVDMLYRTLMEQ